jgi:hypothetical protein
MLPHQASHRRETGFNPLQLAPARSPKGLLFDQGTAAYVSLRNSWATPKAAQAIEEEQSS